MDTCNVRLVMAVLLATATVTEAMNYLALPRMGRSGYLAFPRMGRTKYLAFPRMGRGGFRTDGSDANKDGADCCMTGLKTEWVPQEGGTTTTQNVCEADSCCLGLREILAQKPDGVFYSMCVPGVASPEEEESSESDAASAHVFEKLKELLQN